MGTTLTNEVRDHACGPEHEPEREYVPGGQLQVWRPAPKNLEPNAKNLAKRVWLRQKYDKLLEVTFAISICISFGGSAI